MTSIKKLSNKQLNEVIATHPVDHSRGKEARAEKQRRDHVLHEEDQEEWRTAIEEQQEGFYQGI